MDSQKLPRNAAAHPGAPLRRTGSPGNKPIGDPKEPKLDRPLRRQYQAAEVLALRNYRVCNNPKLEPKDVGIRSNADPDFRIEGIIFDCYTPDPPLCARRKSLAVEFVNAEARTVDDWDEQFDDDVQQRVRSDVKRSVLETIRNAMMSKVGEKQAFNIVLNLTDVRGNVTPMEVQLMLQDRGVEKLEKVLIVAPGPQALPVKKCLYQERFEVAINDFEQYPVPLYADEDFEVVEFSLQ